MMKKLFVLMAVFGLLLTTSCEKEDLISASGNEVTVSFTIPSPDGVLSTRAFGDGESVNTLYYSVYDAEGILLAVSGVKNGAFQTDVDSEGRPIETVDLRLVKGQEYTVVFWAQSGTNAFEIAKIGDEYDLTNIRVKYNSAKANNESRDAFFGKHIITEVTSDKSYTVTLKRPFAQVNVGVDEQEWNDAVAAGVTVEESAISLTGIPNKFNAVTGDATGSVDVNFTSADIPEDSEKLKIDLNGDDDTDDDGETLKYLTMVYILAHEGSNTTDAILDFTGSDSESISVAVDKMPYQRNYRTNIFGRVLTRSNDFKVIVDSKFDDDNNIKLNEEDVADVAALDSKLGAYTGTEAVVYNVESVSDDDVVVVPVGYPADKLTLNFAQVADDVTISGDYAGTVVVKFPATPQVSGLVVNMPNAHVILQQGSYSTVLSTTSSSTLVVAEGVKVTKVEVKAGNVKVMPESEVAEVAKHEDNENPVVLYVEEGAETPATVGEDVKVYVENKDDAGDNVYVYTLTEDLNLNEIYTISEPVIFDGNGKTITSTAGRAINVDTEGDVTIKNLTIVAENSERGINVINKAVNLTLENVNVTAASYAVNVYVPGKSVNVNIKDSELTALNVVNVNAADGATVTVEGTTLNCNDQSEEENYAALSLCMNAANTSIAANGCTFNIKDDSFKAKNESPNGTITIDGSTDEVVVMVAAIVFDGGYYYSFDNIQDAIDYAVDINHNEIKALRQIVINEEVTIDLKGKKFVSTENFELFKVIEGGKLTISNGTAEAYASVIWNNGGEVVINGGTYNQTGTALGTPSTKRYAIKTDATATTTVNDGTFTSNNGIFDASGTVVINGGSYNNEIKVVATRHMMYVWGSGNVTINGGEFRSVANSSAGGECICINTSNANVLINDGKFTSLWSSGSANRIITHYSSGSTVNVTGGLFNNNGGIDSFVEENTDPATKDAYPYKSK